jgi:hypothetical protein
VATIDRDVTSIIAATGWTGATVANLSTSNDARATDGVAGELISAELDDSPGDFGSLNSVTLHVEARFVGTVTRAKSVLVELLDSGDNILESFNTGTITASDVAYDSTAFSRSDAASVIDGYRLRCTVQEAGGMADSATVEIDRMWITLDYDVAAAEATGTAVAGLAFGAAAAGAIAIVASAAAGLVFGAAAGGHAQPRDDFDDNSLNPVWTELGTGTVAETGQQLHISPSSGAIKSIRWGNFDHTLVPGERWFIELTQKPNSVDNMSAVLRLYDGSVEALAGLKQDPTLGWRLRLLVTGQTIQEIAYDDTAHRWFGVRYESGDDTIRCDSSPNGIDWTERHSLPSSSISLTGLRAIILVGSLGAGAPGTAIFDNFNTPGTVDISGTATAPLAFSANATGDIDIAATAVAGFTVGASAAGTVEDAPVTITVVAGTSFQTVRGWSGLTQFGVDEFDNGNIADTFTHLPVAMQRIMGDLGLTELCLQIYHAVAFDTDKYVEACEGTSATWIPHRHTAKLTGDPSTGTETHFFSDPLLKYDRIIRPWLEAASEWGGFTPTFHMRILGYFEDANQDQTDKYNPRDFPDRHANTIVALFQALKAHSTTPDRPGGWYPDTLELINEPNSSSAQWTGTDVGDHVEAVGNALASAGFTVSIWVPGTFSVGNAPNFYNDAKAADAGNPAKIDGISFHLYDNPPEGDAKYTAVNTIRVNDSVLALQTELNGLNVWKARRCLRDANASLLQKLSTAYGGNPNNWPTDGASYTSIANQSGGGFSPGDVNLSESAKVLRLLYRYVRPGSVRKDLSVSDSGADALAFTDPSGFWAVLVWSDSAQTVAIDDLPAATYKQEYAIATQRDEASNDSGTTLTSWNNTRGDTVLGASESLQISMNADEICIVYDDRISPPPDPSSATLMPQPPALTGPAQAATVDDGDVEVSWSAVTDPAGGTIQYRGEYREKVGSAVGAAWSELFAAQTATTYNWDVAGLDDGDYEWRVYAIASTGLESVPSAWEVRTGLTSGYRFISVEAAAEISGTVAAGLALGASADGETPVSATASAGLLLSADAQAAVPASASATAGIALGATAQGDVAVSGTATAGLAFGVTAQGDVALSGSATAGLVFSVTAQATQSIVTVGSATAAVAFGADAQGEVEVQGAASAGLELGATAQGDIAVSGSGTAGVVFGAQAIGDIPIAGTASAGLVLGAFAQGTGLTVSSGTATAGLVFGAGAQAEAEAQAIASAGLVFGVSTQGAVDVQAIASAGLELGANATAEVPISGVGTAGLVFGVESEVPVQGAATAGLVFGATAQATGTAPSVPTSLDISLTATAALEVGVSASESMGVGVSASQLMGVGVSSS